MESSRSCYPKRVSRLKMMFPRKWFTRKVWGGLGWAPFMQPIIVGGSYGAQTKVAPVPHYFTGGEYVPLPTLFSLFPSDPAGPRASDAMVKRA
eukprot:1152351-Pelagomonas_calceolata.AAC.5